MTKSKDQLKLTTHRLVLRPLGIHDAEGIAALLNDMEIAQWLSTVPHPYTLQDAEWFIMHMSVPLRFAVVDRASSQLMGCISIETELGYWLGRDFWGQGFMKEAANCLVSYWFDQGYESLSAGYFMENQRSSSILYGLGFTDNARRMRYSFAQGREVESQELLLTKAAWQYRHSG